MRIDIASENGMLPDRFGKHAPQEYTLDTMLGPTEGFYLNELLWAMEGHIVDTAAQHVRSRA